MNLNRLFSISVIFESNRSQVSKARPGPPNFLYGQMRATCRQGLDVSKNPSPGGSGEVFLLDIPFYRTRRNA
jgi:hypothetical protein